ncbi:hypothetical protein Efla_003524 [Eimeria flavescens]
MQLMSSLSASSNLSFVGLFSFSYSFSVRGSRQSSHNLNSQNQSSFRERPQSSDSTHFSGLYAPALDKIRLVLSCPLGAGGFPLSPTFGCTSTSEASETASDSHKKDLSAIPYKNLQPALVPISFKFFARFLPAFLEADSRLLVVRWHGRSSAAAGASPSALVHPAALSPAAAAENHTPETLHPPPASAFPSEAAGVLPEPTVEEAAPSSPEAGGAAEPAESLLSQQDAHAAAPRAQQRRKHGTRFLVGGLVLLAAGVAMTAAGSSKQTATMVGASAGDGKAPPTLQQTKQVLEKLGLTSPSHLGIGCLLAGLIELFRGSMSTSSSSEQDGQDAPSPKGRMLLLLAVAFFLGSVSSGNVDLSSLHLGELGNILKQYMSKAHLGLFAAGGFELFSSLREAQKQKGQQQRQQEGSEKQQPHQRHHRHQRQQQQQQEQEQLEEEDKQQHVDPRAEQPADSAQAAGPEAEEDASF